MPVALEQFAAAEALGSDDRTDLERLRADHPDPGELPEQRFQRGEWLVAGRFNGRLLAAAWLLEHSERWRIADLCVRAMTRRRGVARQLLTLLAREADSRGRALFTADTEACVPLAPLLRELGFERTGSDWRRSPL